MLAAQQWLRPERSGTGFHLFLQVGAAAVVSNGTVLALLGPGDCFSTQSEEGTSYLGNCAILSVTPSTWLQLPAARYFAALRQDPELASRAVAAQAEAKIWNMRYQEMLACRHVLRRVVGVATLLLARAGSTCPALLYDQARGKRYRPGTGDSLQPGEGKQRVHMAGQRAGKGNHSDTLLPRGPAKRGHSSLVVITDSLAALSGAAPRGIR